MIILAVSSVCDFPVRFLYVWNTKKTPVRVRQLSASLTRHRVLKLFFSLESKPETTTPGKLKDNTIYTRD